MMRLAHWTLAFSLVLSGQAFAQESPATDATAAVTESSAPPGVTEITELPVEEEQAPLAATAPTATEARDFSGGIVRDVRLEGLQRIEDDTVRMNINQGLGVPLEPETIAGDINRLFELGYFSDVTVLRDTLPSGDVVLTYRFQERPIVRNVTFSGNEEIENEKIQEVIDVRSRSILNETKLREIQRKIRNLYVDKGFNFTQVFYDLTTLPNNEVSINFRIEENLKVYVHRIILVGNSVYDDDELKGLIETSEYKWYSFITSSGVFKEGSLERDVEAITNLYLNNGYIKVRLDKPKVYLSTDRKWADVTYVIDEGPQYFVGDIQFSGDQIFKEADVRAEMRTRQPLPFSRERLSADVQRISERYQDIGFAFVAVNPLTDIDEEEKRVNLNFQVDKGNLVYIDKIRIKGNTKTRDKVIRRELLITEGQLFDGTALRNSRARAFALGFFEEVNFTTEPSGPSKIDVIIEVKERATGTLSAGVGYNSLDRFLGIAQVSFGNLGGYGIRLNTQAEFGARRQFYTVSYTDPYFLDSKWSLGGDLFNNSRDYGVYTQESVGGALNAGYLVYLNTRVYANYKYEDISLDNFIGGGTNFFRSGATGSLGTSIVRNTKNHPYDPSGGSVATASVEWASPIFGGENNFMKYNLQGTYFYHLFYGVVASTRAEVAWATSTVGGRIPFTERYFLGGITSLRGYNYRQVGPRVTIPGSNVSDFFQPVEVVAGGNKMIVSNNEIVFPIIPPAGIKGVVFFDAGNAYAEEQAYFDEPLRLATGFGIRWFSPIGPLRFEWGFPIKKRPDERNMVFEFSIGTFF
jgi:outer membrane protein insertion porin family